jgi:cyclic pyranopterin phosphate synthase
MRSFMSAEEILRLVKALSELGVCMIRLTGGEHTVIKYIFDILKDMKQNFCKIY